MNTNMVFIAFNRGGVIVDKEVSLNLSEDNSTNYFGAFKHKSSQHFCTFLTERELGELTRRIEQKSAGPVIIR